MTHAELRESLPGYALHTLALEDARGVEAHLATCAECQRELAVFEETAASLAAGFAPQRSPPALRGRVLDAVRPRRRSLDRLGLAWATALAAAAAIIVVLAAIVLSLEQRRTALITRLESEASALALLADSSSRIVTLGGSAAGSVRFVYDPTSGRGALIATGLRDPGPDLVYQVWLVAGTTPESAGVFRPASGAPVIVAVGADFPRYQAVAVSVEHGPNGATRPSAAPVLVGKLGGG
jgi:anti-sigma-K factor RskA